jgi:cobalt/nickel transport system permease protein
MSDALLSGGVGVAMAAASVAALGYSAYKLKNDEAQNFAREGNIPLMGVMGALVFALQMLNFTVPLTGSSGHIVGSILLAAVLGPYAALFAISSVLIIQSLIFADGGILALGANIFNMGVIPALLVFPLVYKKIVKNGLSRGKIILASSLSVVIALQLGAFAVVLETTASGITELPFGTFLLLMQPIHLAISVGEAIITSLVLTFIFAVRPEILGDSLASGKGRSIPLKKAIVAIAGLALIGCVLSQFASGNPDGLEWSIGNIYEEELPAEGVLHSALGEVQSAVSPMPDYAFKSPELGESPILPGIIGGIITLGLALLVGASLSFARRKA